MNAMFGDFAPQLPALPWGMAGQPSHDPMVRQRVAQQVESLRNQMQQREMMNRGMAGQQDPQVGAMMAELESRLGGGPQWRDTTGLGARMSRLPMPQEEAPQGPQGDPGLLLQALQLAARNSGTYDGGPGQMRGMDAVDARTNAQQGWPGASQGREVIDRNSAIPLSEEPWFDQYVAAGQAGADLPIIKGGAVTDSPEMLARRAAHREARIANERAGLLPMEERRAMVRSRAIADTAARHGRMGIADREPQYDLLNRLQGMEGANDPTSRAGFAGNLAVMGPQGALGAMQGAYEAATQAGRNQIDNTRNILAPILAALNGGLVPPGDVKGMIEKAMALAGGGAGGMALPATPQGPQRARPGGPLEAPLQDAGLQEIWSSKPEGWSGEMFIRAAQGSGYSPADAIQFLMSRGLDNPRAPGIVENFYGASTGETPPLQGWLMDLLEQMQGPRPAPAKLHPKFANQLQ